MPNVNKVILMGVLGLDPEAKQFPNSGSKHLPLSALLHQNTGKTRPLESVKNLQNGTESPPVTD